MQVLLRRINGEKGLIRPSNSATGASSVPSPVRLDVWPLLWPAATPSRFDRGIPKMVIVVCIDYLGYDGGGRGTGIYLSRLESRERSPVLSSNQNRYRSVVSTELPKDRPLCICKMGSQQIDQVDVLLVGAGFASFTLLNR